VGWEVGAALGVGGGVVRAVGAALGVGSGVDLGFPLLSPHDVNVLGSLISDAI
jgi:hypothetical protein